MTGWLLRDFGQRAAGTAHWVLPAALGVMTTATGITAVAGTGGTFLVIYGFVAAMMAGSECDLAAALAVTAAGILAIEVAGLASGGSYAALIGFPSALASGLIIGRNRAAYRIQAEQSAALLAQRERLRGRAAPGRPARRARPHRPRDPRRARALPRRARASRSRRPDRC